MCTCELYQRDRVVVRMCVCIETIPNSTTSPILIIKVEWPQRILHEGKDLEIRSWQLRNWPCRIWLCGSGTSGMVYGWVDVEEMIGPLTEDDWRATRELHQVPSKRMFGERTWAWKLGARGELPVPLRIVRSGARGIQYGSGLSAAA